MNIRGLCIASGVLLLLAIPSGWPYGFYVLLRWAISISSVIIAYGFYQSKLSAWALIFGGVAFLFNPLIPVFLDKSSWVMIDFISSLLFFLAAYSGVKQKIK
jgi:hypothetical protein